MKRIFWCTAALGKVALGTVALGLSLVAAPLAAQQASPALMPVPSVPASIGYAVPQRFPAAAAQRGAFDAALASHCEDCAPQADAGYGAGCAPLSISGCGTCADSGSYDCYGGGCGAGGGADGGYAAAGCGGGFGGGCFGPPCCPGWFGSAGAIVMGRSRPNRVYFSSEAAAPQNQLLSGPDAIGDWSGGWDFTVGRSFCSGWAISGTYWGMSELESTASVSGTFYNTPINLSGLGNLGSFAVPTYFDGSPEHRLSRRDLFSNVEINAWSAPWYMSCTGGTGVRFLAGVRYFQFHESLIFGSVAGPGTQDNGGGNLSTGNFGDNGGANEAYYRVRTSNNLIGPQFGLFGRAQLLPRLGIYAMPKMGLMANQVTQSQQLYTGDGIYGFDLASSKTACAFLGSIDVGLNYCLTERWYLYGGYRVVAIANVATADSQVPQFMQDFPEMSRIRSNDSLVVHGAIMGIGANF